ncbi:hypothetical protein BC834DRAFT_1022257 [Gloeopeniophorella convolvens]|nr:hypothetical protein BC834DRAFT_1022257 [Gloeopeniophorella convolvens]
MNGESRGYCAQVFTGVWQARMDHDPERRGAVKSAGRRGQLTGTHLAGAGGHTATETRRGRAIAGMKFPRDVLFDGQLPFEEYESETVHLLKYGLIMHKANNVPAGSPPMHRTTCKGHYVSRNANWFDDLLVAVCSMHKLGTLSLDLRFRLEHSPIEDGHGWRVPRLRTSEFAGVSSQLKVVNSRLGVPHFEDLAGITPRLAREATAPFLPGSSVIVGLPPSKDVKFDIDFRACLSVALWSLCSGGKRTRSPWDSALIGTHDGSYSGEVADATFWRAFLSKSIFTAVEVLWGDDAVLPALIDVLDQAGPMLLPKLTTVGVCFYHPTLRDEGMTAFKTAVELKYEGVKVDHIAISREESWPDRFLHLERLLSKHDGDELKSESSQMSSCPSVVPG